MASEIIAYQVRLNSLGVSLHQSILNKLVKEIEESIESGLVRSKDGFHSVYDFIRVILGQKSERKVWKRFTENDPDTVALCHGVKMPRQDGKEANVETPATDIAGLIYIAYMGSGDFSQSLRRASAALTAKEYGSSPMPSEAADRIEKLEQALADTHEALENYPYTLDRLQKTSGIVNRWQVKESVLRDFVEERDYIWADGKLAMNESTFNILVVSFRSVKGADISQLPEIIKINTAEYFRVHRRRKNDRLAHRTHENQMSLFEDGLTA